MVRDDPDNLGYWPRFFGRPWMEARRLAAERGAVSTSGRSSYHRRIQKRVAAAATRRGSRRIAAGTFHPVWIDNRTGTHQVWTASVAVSGVAHK